MVRRWAAFVGTLILLAAGPVSAVELSVWALQSDLQAAAGVPGTSIPPAAIEYNPRNGKLLIAGGGNQATVFEWAAGATTGTVLVPRTNWGFGANPQPYAVAYVPSRNSYLVEDGGTDNVIREVLPGVAGQTPGAFLTFPSPPFPAGAFPAGGLPVDGTYAYYKFQVTSPTDQSVHRFTLTGASGIDSEYIPYSAFTAVNGTGPSQQFVLDSAGKVVLSLRTDTANKLYKGLYRWNATALVPIIQAAGITAHTGQTNVGIYGLAVDRMDNFYFYEVYAGAILKVDRWGSISTLLTDTDVRDFLGNPELSLWPQYMAVANNRLVFTTGPTSGHVLAVRLPADVELATVPGTDYEIDGPTYSYNIGKYEITNAQYCTFLNDAELLLQTTPSDPRCTNMWIESTTGDVYMTDVSAYGPTSPERYDRTLYKTSDVPDSKIKYDITQVPGSRFYVLPGFNHHPVGTVSWFGAAKFCNWLTIDQGLPATDLTYHEGTSKSDWYAITATNWAVNGLLDSERLDLVRNYRGFRLPMDGYNVDNGGPSVSWSWNMDAAPYNEWYKAAAFDPAAPDTVRAGPGESELVQPDHWIFGYGADTNTNADANHGNTGYPGWQTTPVGWYDGINTLFDGTPTVDTRNRYGLYDMCGNVAEWNNDTALESPWGATNYRVTRGGSWGVSNIKYATNSSRNITSARYYASNSVGFRVARSPGYGDFNADAVVDLNDFAFFLAAFTGPDQPIAAGYGYEACDYNGDGHVDLVDFAAFQRRVTAP
jgi:formylglycine-generating enzyme required for sulfatase activity